MTERLFPLATYSSVVTVLAGLGISFDEIAQQAGLPHGVIADPGALISARQFHELVAMGRSLSGNDPAFAMNITGFLRLDMIDGFGPMLATTATVRTFIEDSIRCAPALNPCVDLMLEESGDEFHVVCCPLPAQGADDRFLHAEAAFSAGIRLMKSIFRRQDLSPLRMEMTHDGREWINAYHSVFGPQVQVQFNRPRNLVAMHRSLLDFPNPGHSPLVHAQMERVVFARLAALPRAETLSTRVTRFLEAEIGRRVLALPDVADYFGMNPRTLQRRLAAEKTTFQELHDCLRHREARRLLAGRDCDIPTLAAILGYSSPSTFLRAFKFWSGMSAIEYRRRHGRGRMAAMHPMHPQQKVVIGWRRMFIPQGPA